MTIVSSEATSLVMPAGPRSPAAALLMAQVEKHVQIALPPGELLDHVELLVRSRRGPNPEDSLGGLNYRRLSTPGSDPQVSLMLLRMFADQLSRSPG